MKTITGKESLRDPIFILFVFSLILGVDMGFLKDNLTSSESIMLRESIISVDNLVWLFLHCCSDILHSKKSNFYLGFPIYLEQYRFY
jgi:hypothetical protein